MNTPPSNTATHRAPAFTASWKAVFRALLMFVAYTDRFVSSEAGGGGVSAPLHARGNPPSPRARRALATRAIAPFATDPAMLGSQG